MTVGERTALLCARCFVLCCARVTLSSVLFSLPRLCSEVLSRRLSTKQETKTVCFFLTRSRIKVRKIKLSSGWPLSCDASRTDGNPDVTVLLCTVLTLPSFDPPEALHIRNSLPDDVIVQRVDERLSGTSRGCADVLVCRLQSCVPRAHNPRNPLQKKRKKSEDVSGPNSQPHSPLFVHCIFCAALGNCISCNDYVALIHPDLDEETEEIVADVLGVEVFRQVRV